MDYGPISLCYTREKPEPTNPQTLGEHLRVRRVQLRLTQIAAAQLFGISRYGYVWWERNFRNPGPAHMRAIIAFLGYDPLPDGDTFAEQLRLARYRLGCDQARFADAIGVPLPTVRAWERAIQMPSPTRMALVNGRVASLRALVHGL